MWAAGNGAEINTQAALSQGHQVVLLFWGNLCPLALATLDNIPSTLEPFISFSGHVSHLCLLELDVRSVVTAASICHLTHPGPGGVNK